jgi:hypothetical protein
MDQRRLRLGDTLDDYCPRERRVTNHAVVAMIEEDVKQTRCTTCDAEHAYKGGKAPRRRKKETPSALFKEVLAGMPEAESAPILAAPAADPTPAPIEEPIPEPPAAVAELSVAEADTETRIDDSEAEPEAEEPQPSGEDWPVHRPLIRAQLPRIEGQKEERRPTDFTIYQPTGRGAFRRDGGARFRGHGGGGGNGNGNGNRGQGGPRFAGGRPAGPGRGQAGRGGPAAGFRGGPPRHGGGKKRSR